MALGAVSFLVYRSSKETLAERNVATRKLIERQYEDLRAKERVRLDEALLSDARRLVDHAQVLTDGRPGQPSFEAPRVWIQSTARHTAQVTGLVSTGNVTSALWAYAALNQLAGLPRFPSAEVKIDDSELHGDDPADRRRLVADYLEIQCGFPNQVTYRSPSLDGAWLSGLHETIPPKEYLGPEYRDVPLQSDLSVRRVLFRYSLHVSHGSGTASQGGTGGTRAPRPPRGGFRVWATVLAAYGPSWLDDASAPFRRSATRI